MTVAVNGNYYRDPQLDGVQRVRILEALSLKYDIFIKSFSLQYNDLCKKGGGKTVRPRGDG